MMHFRKWAEDKPVLLVTIARQFVIGADDMYPMPIRNLRDNLNKTGQRTGRGRLFTASTIHHILENDAYIGACVYNKRTESKWHRLTSGQSVERQDEGLELRPESDWIVKPDAWPALVDKETFETVQARRKASKAACVKMTGAKVHSSYLLTGRFFCGVCGGKMVGVAHKSGKGIVTRYYACVTHHKGDYEACPKRYTVPVSLVEGHILGLIKADLTRLGDDDQLHEYVTSEVQRVKGSLGDTGILLQRRLADLDQQAAKLRDHLKELDHDTAETLGMYTEARRITEERQKIEQELEKVGPALPKIPSVAEIKARAAAAFNRLGEVLDNGTIEEKRELIGLYVQKIKANPDTCTVQISLYPSLFNTVVAGACSSRVVIIDMVRFQYAKPNQKRRGQNA